MLSLSPPLTHQKPQHTAGEHPWLRGASPGPAVLRQGGQLRGWTQAVRPPRRSGPRGGPGSRQRPSVQTHGLGRPSGVAEDCRVTCGSAACMFLYVRPRRGFRSLRTQMTPRRRRLAAHRRRDAGLALRGIVACCPPLCPGVAASRLSVLQVRAHTHGYTHARAPPPPPCRTTPGERPTKHEHPHLRCTRPPSPGGAQGEGGGRMTRLPEGRPTPHGA